MLRIDSKRPDESAKDYVVRQLVYNIVHINLVPGQQLDTAELCELLHVSKNPLREAELELAQSDLLQIKSKVGVFVAPIDTEFVEEIRSLRSVLESELAREACDLLNKEQIDRLWENIALWTMYIKRNEEEKVFQLDKEFHAMLYQFCNRLHWYDLVNRVAPHFDRTTVLSFRCREKNHILKDHEELVAAIEARDKEKAVSVTKLHMTRYIENIETIKQQFSSYFTE